MAQALGSLPVGKLVKDVNTKYGGNVIIWRIIGQNHDGNNTTTLRTEYVLTEKYFDKPEPANSDYNRQQYGDDRYSHSNILSWLNSDREDNSWYVQRHLEDVPPSYYNEAGFLNGFGSGFKEALIEVDKNTAQCLAVNGYNSNGIEVVTSRIFLPSLDEVGISGAVGVNEGTAYEYYTDDNSRKIYKTDKTTLSTYMLRSPQMEMSGKLYYIKTDGKKDIHSVSAVAGIAPCCTLASATEVSNYADEDDGVFVLNLANTSSGSSSSGGSSSSTTGCGYLDYVGLDYFASRFGGILPQNPTDTANINMWMEV